MGSQSFWTWSTTIGARKVLIKALVKDGVLAYHRWDQGGPGDDVVVVANLKNRSLPSYNVGFPRSGTWFLRFNSDFRGFSPDFGNVGYDTTANGGGTQGMPFDGNVGLGPYGVCIYSQ